MGWFQPWASSKQVVKKREEEYYSSEAEQEEQDEGEASIFRLKCSLFLLMKLFLYFCLFQNLNFDHWLLPLTTSLLNHSSFFFPLSLTNACVPSKISQYFSFPHLMSQRHPHACVPAQSLFARVRWSLDSCVSIRALSSDCRWPFLKLKNKKKLLLLSLLLYCECTCLFMCNALIYFPCHRHFQLPWSLGSDTNLALAVSSGSSRLFARKPFIFCLFLFFTYFCLSLLLVILCVVCLSLGRVSISCLWEKKSFCYFVSVSCFL